MSRVYESGGIMDDESDAGKRTLSGELDEVLVRSEVVMGDSEDTAPGMECETFIIF